MDHTLLLILFIGFIILQIIWLLNDPRPGSEILKFSLELKGHYARAALITVLTAIFIKRVLFPHLPTDWPSTPYDGIITLIGLMLYCIGFILAAWARITMKRYWLPAGEGHNPKKQTKLITAGPFRFTRNPIYLGMIMFYLGFGLALHSYATIFVLFLMFYFYKSILSEEKLLTKQFGKTYLDYKSRVRRFL